MAIADPGINPATFSNVAAFNAEAASLSAVVSHSVQRIKPVKQVSEAQTSKLHDTDVEARVPRLENDGERKREVLRQLKDKWDKSCEKEGFYNSELNFEPHPPLGLIVDIYC